MRSNNSCIINLEPTGSSLQDYYKREEIKLLALRFIAGLLTPLHIVPEWYFLCQYAMLKAVPNKNAGFIILLTSIFTFFFFGEIRNLTTLCLLNNNYRILNI